MVELNLNNMSRTGPRPRRPRVDEQHHELLVRGRSESAWPGSGPAGPARSESARLSESDGHCPCPETSDWLARGLRLHLNICQVGSLSPRPHWQPDSVRLTRRRQVGFSAVASESLGTASFKLSRPGGNWRLPPLPGWSLRPAGPRGHRLLFAARPAGALAQSENENEKKLEIRCTEHAQTKKRLPAPLTSINQDRIFPSGH